MATDDGEERTQARFDALWAAGDRDEAAALVVRRWAERLKRYALRWKLTPPDAEEVVYWAFFRVLRKHESSRYQSLMPVLYKAVKHLALNHRRSRQLHGAAKLDATHDLPDQEESLESILASGEVRRSLRRAVAALPETHRKIMELRYYGEPCLPVNGIAAALHMRQRTVEKKLKEGHDRLRRALAREEKRS
jgi:RNA polymerase sigma factor (sigma-70 family)